MKKSIALILALLMVFSLVACGSDENTESASDAGKSYTISIAHACSEDSTAHIASVGFKDDIEAATNGRITVEIFPNGLMGGDLTAASWLQVALLPPALPRFPFLLITMTKSPFSTFPLSSAAQKNPTQP
mgnify:CR=1 FL=1